MTAKKSRTQIASAVSLALSSMMLSSALNAAQLVGAYVPQAGDVYTTGAGNPTENGSWNLTNVTVFRVTDEVVTADEFTDAELADGIDALNMVDGDSFVSYVYASDPGADPLNPVSTQMARVSGKVWPVGGPTGIKAVMNDGGVKNGKPINCLINTSFLEGAYLDVTPPAPVICSSPFQSHKRFKIAMLPGTVDGVADGAASTKPIDLVFNVDGTGRDTAGNPIPYQVFSKINNYTGKFLKGYQIVVGKGTGANFKSASELGIASELYISLGIAEGPIDSTTQQPTDLFDSIEGFATFSRGLFGPHDEKIYDPVRFATDGFFDVRTAGFQASQGCATTGCVDETTVTGIDGQDKISSGAVLPSFYSEFFGQWLHSGVAPKGLYRFEGVNVDATLIAWWNGQNWVKPYEASPLPAGTGIRPNPGEFITVTDAELQAMAAQDGLYYVDVIEDTLNLGINYIVKLGQVVQPVPTGGSDLLDDPNFTVRIIPVVGDQTQATPWTARVPVNGDLTFPTTLETLPTTTTSSSSGGGGCAVGGSGRFDPTLPALLAMGLGFFGWRRFKAGK